MVLHTHNGSYHELYTFQDDKLECYYRLNSNFICCSVFNIYIFVEGINMFLIVHTIELYQ